MPRVPWILVPHVPRSSRALMPCVHRLLGALVPHVPCPYSLSCLTCLPYSFTSRVLCLAWSCAASASCPLCSCTLIPQLLQMFQVWLAHAHLMSHIFHVLCLLCFWCLNYSSSVTMFFSYKWFKLPRSINLPTLANFMLLVSFFSPWKY